MPKGASSKKRGAPATSKRGNNVNNGPAPQRLRKKASAAERTALLTHDTKEKRSDMKLKLHLRRTQRSLELLRQRLEHWDPVEEEEKKKKRELSEKEEPQKKRPRFNSPETWTLRGAARPASLVYDFDTRYVDPYIQAHEKHKEKSKRLRNLLLKDSCDLATFAEGREFLSLLMQYGHLNQEAKNYTVARETFQECISLDRGSATTAAESLITMFMETGKHQSALQLGMERHDDSSVCLRFATALAAHILHHEKCDQIMEQAIRANILCGHYLCNVQVFQSAIECVAEIEEVESDLEEALQYCDEYATQWESSGASKALRSVMNRMTNVPGWEEALAQESRKEHTPGQEQFYESMFRTAMGMVSERRHGSV